MQRILYLYLNTGGGHISGARALKAGMENLFPGRAEGHLLHGYPPRLVLDRLVMEQGYSLAINHFMPGYLLVYKLAELRPLITLSQETTAQACAGYIASHIRRLGITKVVCLHFILEKAARDAIRQVDPAMPLVTVVMDPFSVPPIWFGVKDQEFCVFSERARRSALDEGVAPERVRVFPLMLRKEFERPRPPGEIPELKRRYGFDPDRPLLLLAGGGDGLPRSDRIVREALKDGFEGQIAVVCGKNMLLRRRLRDLRSRLGARDLKIYGFVDFMADLMAMADCVVTKAGPATVMETLALRKPLILSCYVRNQEKGNVQFVTSNKVGWYLTEPSDIVGKTREIFGKPELRRELEGRIAGLGIRNGLSDLARHIFEL
ncbi:MAG TPA: glycosyltransferase [Spirochaetia bacterium]|nr:glycosyltransferase [Spirochaetales bacterium]HRY79352.1 glycosyltransferase [Spirochaetia bacterium]